MIRRLTVPPFEALDPYLPRVAGADQATRQTVAAILDDVLARGDLAVVDYTRQYDQVDLQPEAWELDAASWQEAPGRVSPPLREALSRAVRRVTEYHQRQRDNGYHLAEPGRQPGWNEGGAPGPGGPLYPGREGVLPLHGDDERGSGPGGGGAGDHRGRPAAEA